MLDGDRFNQALQRSGTLTDAMPLVTEVLDLPGEMACESPINPGRMQGIFPKDLPSAVCRFRSILAIIIGRRFFVIIFPLGDFFSERT